MHKCLSVALGKLHCHHLNCHLLLKRMLLLVLGQSFLAYLLLCDFSPFSFHVLTLSLSLWSPVGECALLS